MNQDSVVASGLGQPSEEVIVGRRGKHFGRLDHNQQGRCFIILIVSSWQRFHTAVSQGQLSWGAVVDRRTHLAIVLLHLETCFLVTGGLVQSLSPARPCVTHGLPGPPVLHSLLELAQTRVH